MRLSLSLPFLALSLFPPDVAANPHGRPNVARHAHEAIARRAPGDVAIHNHTKRVENARMSFYDVQTGNEVACGGFHYNGEFVVALNVAQFDKATWCGKTISVSWGGKSQTATVLDMCPGCPWGGLDLTAGLFAALADPALGIIYGEWHLIDSNPPPNTPTPTPTPAPYTPTTTSTPPTTTQEPWTTTTPPPPPPSTTSSWTSSSSTHLSSSGNSRPSSSTSSSSTHHSSGAPSNSPAPPGLTVSDNTPNNLLAMNQAFVAVGDIVVAGAKHHG